MNIFINQAHSNKADIREYSLFISWFRPTSYRHVAVYHLLPALITGAALLLADFIPRYILPLISCLFLRFTGYPCPFCGFTRSFWAMADSNWAFAFNNCPLSCLLYGAVIVVFSWNVAALMFGIIIKRGRFFQIESDKKRWAVFFFSALIILNWIYRISSGLT
jgi:hypothetical protein